MNKRQWKREACTMVANVIRTAMDGGWPFTEPADRWDVPLEDEDGNLTADGERAGEALDELLAEMERRGKRYENE